MAEPSVRNGKTRAQLDAQIGRIDTAMDRAFRNATTQEEMRRLRNRWVNATDAYGRLSGDEQKIQEILDYRPASRMFTSNEEIERLNQHFGLENRSVASLRALRNNVVKTWSNRERDGRQAWDRDDMTPWMQSITAVIDYYISRKGGEI